MMIARIAFTVLEAAFVARRDRRSLRRTARKHRRNVGLCEIQHNVCQAAADARHNAARYGNGKVFLQHVAGDFTLVREEAATAASRNLNTNVNGAEAMYAGFVRS